METLSNRYSEISQSTTRSNRKGLSLTSKSRCSSSQRQTKSVISIDTGIESQIFKASQSQCSISYLNNHHFTTFQFSSTDKMLKVIQKPKITFRYTNQILNLNYAQRMNSFLLQQNFNSIDNNATVRPTLSRPEKQFQNVRITRSGQKSIGKTNFIPILQNQETKMSRPLIDSRKVDRQIFYEQRYQNIPLLNSQFIEKSKYQDCQSNQNHLFVSQRKQSKNQTCNLSGRKSNLKKLHQNLSPYHLLISTAKRCQSQQVSPSIFKAAQNQALLTLNSLERIPQIQQFNPLINNEEDEKQDNQKLKKFSKQSKCTKVFSNKSVRFAEELKAIQQKFEGRKQYKIVQKSPLKPLNLNSSDKNRFINLENIQNIPPSEGKQVVSGKRNNRRIKQIQKRLEQIITICSYNL